MIQIESNLPPRSPAGLKMSSAAWQLLIATSATALLTALLWWETHLDRQDMQAVLTLWVLAVLLAQLLARRLWPPLLIARSRAPLIVLIAAALFGMGLAAFGYTSLIAGVWPAPLLWLALSFAYHLRRRRRSVLGVPAGLQNDPQSALLRHPDVDYRVIRPDDPRALEGLDGLVIQYGRISPAQQPMLAHAHAMKLPVLDKTLLDEELSGKVALSSLNPEWLSRQAFQAHYGDIKRILDIVATLLALPVLLPLMLVVAAVVYVNSGRPILFWQERVGRNGVPFRLVKFRTMTRDSERAGAAFAQRGDQRVTPVGAFLRKFRLDELPQFYNVLRGEMSIIGPRPEQWAFVAEFEESIPMYATRHWVRPGITGWAQVNQGYAAGINETTEKLNYDFYYIKHHSLATDLSIVWKTLLTILTGFGAR